MASSDPLEHVLGLVRRKFACDEAGATLAAQTRCVGVVGAGIMGSAIAAAHVAHGKRVVLVDNNPTVLAAARSKITQDILLASNANYWPAAIDAVLREMSESTHRPKSLEEAEALVAEQLQTSSDLAAFADADLVIESIVEKIDVKRNLFEALKTVVRDDAVMTTNSSALSISRLAESWPQPELFCGFHFCHPVRERPLAEIVSHSQTSERTIAFVSANAKAIGKMPLVTLDKPGFLVNRLLFPLLSAAMELAQEGFSLDAIDSAAEEFGFAKGPFRLMDEIGLDTILQAGWTLAEAFPERVPSSPLLVSLLKAKRLGCKTGRGFFAYVGEPPQKIKRDDPELTKMLTRWRQPKKETNEALLDRLLAPMAAEARLAVDDGVVVDADEIDLSTIFGLGFPPSRGGLHYWSQT